MILSFMSAHSRSHSSNTRICSPAVVWKHNPHSVPPCWTKTGTIPQPRNQEGKMRATPIPIPPNSREGSWTQTPAQAVHSCCHCCVTGPSPRSHLTRAALEEKQQLQRFSSSLLLCYSIYRLSQRGVLIEQSKGQPEEGTLVLQAKKNGKTTGLKWPVPSLSPTTPCMSMFLIF